MTTKEKVQDRRYYLHRKLKGKYTIDADKRTISVPQQSFEAIPVGDRYYVGQLIQMGYNMQFQLF
ncbi:MAG: hypothetical protein WBP45_11115 [Daejeonella sp.]